MRLVRSSGPAFETCDKPPLPGQVLCKTYAQFVRRNILLHQLLGPDWEVRQHHAERLCRTSKAPVSLANSTEDTPSVGAAWTRLLGCDVTAAPAPAPAVVPTVDAGPADTSPAWDAYKARIEKRRNAKSTE